MDKTQNNKPEKLYNFEFLRIILTIAILVHHFYHVVLGKWNSGGYAVEFFFIISGFLFAITYNSSKTLIDFAIGKLIRFVPLITCTSIALAICTKFEIQRLFADIFLLQRTGLYQIGIGDGYNSPAWYVSVLFWILLFYFCIRKTFSYQKSNIIFSVLTFFAISAYLTQNVPIFISKHLLRGLGAVGIGYFAGLITQCLPNKNIKNGYKLAESNVEFIIFFILSYLLFSSYKITNKVAMMFLMAFLLVLFFVKKGFISNFLNNKIVSNISKYVLSVYLTHAYLYKIVLPKYIIPHYPEVINYPIIVCIFGVIASFMLGIIAHYLIEKPSAKYLTNLYNTAKTLAPAERERERVICLPEIFQIQFAI